MEPVSKLPVALSRRGRVPRLQGRGAQACPPHPCGPRKGTSPFSPASNSRSLCTLSSVLPLPPPQLVLYVLGELPPAPDWGHVSRSSASKSPAASLPAHDAGEEGVSGR